MKQGRLICVGGGVRSGKSAFALSLARSVHGGKVFLATAQGGDERMLQRIQRHQAERGSDFRTIEEPVHVPEIVSDLAPCDVVVMDCLTLWLSNLLLAGLAEESILNKVVFLLDVLRERTGRFIIVTNEVGMGVVPDSELGRVFRDIAGRAHQLISAQADEIYFAVMGTVLQLKPFITMASSKG